MSGAGDNGSRLGPGRPGPYEIETYVPGDPAAFHSLATYLRSGMSAKVDVLGEDTAAHRTALRFTWEGEAGDAFLERSGRLVLAADRIGLDVRIVAEEFDTLGDTLRSTQDGLAQLRAEAPGLGLRVEGTVIRPPADAFFDMDTSDDGSIAQPWDVTAAKMAAWPGVVDAAEGYWARWYDAMNDAGGVVSERSADMVEFLSDLVTVGATRSLKTISSRIMSKQAEWLREHSAKLKGHAAALEDYIARTGDESAKFRHFEWQMESIESRYAADAADSIAKDPPLPPGVRGGLGSVTALATGVGIYADVHDGESGTQAVVSQGAGLVAGTLMAAGVGWAAGSFAPGPGNIGGAIVVGGAELIVGTATAIGVDNLVDSIWPGGDDQEEQPSETERYGGTLLEYAGQVTTPEPPTDEGGAR